MNSSHDQSPVVSGRHDGLPPLAPDFIEQDQAEDIDNIVPTRGYQMTPMIGLGGSAGSIQALVKFFKAMPPDSGMVFVVILHLSPTHESTMATLLAGATSMPVVQATDGQKVAANHVYVIPPGKYLATTNGHLRLTELEVEKGKRVAIDFFFRSLADTHGPHAAAIVLSGADGDGALGIKRIKERGGLTIAQDPHQAEYPSMPETAIDTGMIDWVLEVTQIPARLIEYRDNGMRLKLPPEEGPPPPTPAVKSNEGEEALRDILLLLRTRTGRDFSYYKRATILRRIARRMQVHGVHDLPEYLTLLRTQAAESAALLQDLLISVTNFFRDRDVFAAIEKRIPDLFAGKGPTDALRVWVPACATGEEAYSFAMLLLEHAQTLDAPPMLQVFACDLDSAAIQAARAGRYPESIAADVSEHRLRHFFAKEAGGYRVRRELREMVLFATHDLLKDAPFSRMDLISCRNLLIYLNREAQQRAFSIFHFALRPSGLLLLGSSESAEDATPLFAIKDKKNRIFGPQPVPGASSLIASRPAALLSAIQSAEQAVTNPTAPGRPFAPGVLSAYQGRLGAPLDGTALASLHFSLLERYAPPSVIVNADHEIMHLSDHAGRFLKFTGGEPSANVLRAVLPDLRIELRTALFRAAETNARADSVDVNAEIEGRRCAVHISVVPAPEIMAGFLLVTFDIQNRNTPSAPAPAGSPGAEPIARHLERELEQVKGNLRDTVEQYEASTEELKASNEELQAMNEELRSATEELETSREELQSINEELTTVNQEMKGKVEEVANANADLQNLMASTAIATVFLDRDLAITRFTPVAAEIFNLIPGDVGRPLAHLKHRLEYPGLIADAEQVLRTLVPIEREVSGDGRWFLARFQPYRTVEDHIAGVVLTLVDVTEWTRAVESLRRSEERLRLLIESAHDYAIFTTDNDRRIDRWNSGAQALFGYTEADILGRSADVLFTPEDIANGEPQRLTRAATEAGHAENERWLSRKDGSIFFGSGSVMPLRDTSGSLRGYVEIMRDLTQSKRSEEAMRNQVAELTRYNEAAHGRDSRILELKKEIDALCAKLGETPRYGVRAKGERSGATPRE
jgi:two-component system CheB/CheR fusion protein